jgi:hypothetical protein
MINADIVRAYGDLINQWYWDWFATLTFRYPVSTRHAYRQFYIWQRLLEKTVRGKVHYILVTEPQRNRDNTPHFHVVLSGIKNENPAHWESEWLKIGGRAQVQVYDYTKGGAYYMSKYLGTDNAYNTDIKFSKGLGKIEVAEQPKEISIKGGM